MDPYELLNGVGNLYVADVGTEFPALDAEPGAEWRNLGDTMDGVTVTGDQKIDEHRVDQETGPVKATRSEENLIIGTTLAEATLENLADVVGGVVEDTAATASAIGTREVPLYRGSSVKTFAFLFRNPKGSPYGEFPAQYELPVGYFGGSFELKHTKEGLVGIGVEFHALVDPLAASATEKFGRLIAQDSEITA